MRENTINHILTELEFTELLQKLEEHFVTKGKFNALTEDLRANYTYITEYDLLRTEVRQIDGNLENASQHINEIYNQIKGIQNHLLDVNHNLKIKANFEDLRRVQDRLELYTPLKPFKQLQNSMIKYALNVQVKYIEEQLVRFVFDCYGH